MNKMTRISMVAVFVMICLSLTWSSQARSEVFNDGAIHDVDYRLGPDGIEVYDGPGGIPTTVNILEGAMSDPMGPPGVRIYNSSFVNMYGGWMDLLEAYNSSTINVYGGNAGVLAAYDDATVNVYDVCSGGICSYQNSTVNIYDGMLAQSMFIESTTVNIYGLAPLEGGNTSYIYVGSPVEQGNTAAVNVYGSDFQIDGQAVGYGPIPITLGPRTLTGTFVYGDVFTLGFQNWCAPPQGTINLIATNQDPVADAGADQNVEQTGGDGAEVTLDGSASSDPDGGALTYSWTWDGGAASVVSPTIFLPLGTTIITLIVNDGTADSQPDTVSITVDQEYSPCLISRWRFDEGTGTIAHDSAGENDANINPNDGEWAIGKVNGAFNFVNAMGAEVPYSTDFDNLYAITIEAWAFRTGTNYSKFIIRGDWQYEPWWIGAGWLAPDDLVGSLRTHDITHVRATGFSTDVWHHVAMTYDSAAVRLYMDGVEVGSVPSSGPIYNGTHPESVFIGGGFNGKLDEVAIYDCALSPQEIASHAGVVLPQNGAPVAAAGPDQSVEQDSYSGASVTLDGSASHDPDSDPLTYSWTWDGGAASVVSPTIFLPPGTTTVTLVVNDATVDSQPDTVDIIVEDTITPQISIIEPTSYGVYPAGGLILDFGATDSGSGVSDCWGTLTDSYGCSGDVDSGFAPGAGVYALVVKAIDLAGNYAESDSVLFVIYDPEGGFVTGGGWILSPTGAYAADITLEGKANFGFVSKYKKDATVPTGNTEFVFQAGDLNFHSSSYDWLVVTGSNYARFKGWGSINGEGSYRFMLWAGDDEPDTFRIKIWWEDDGIENVVYDNGMDQQIEGGSIIIHAK